jgi:hypothetical protein
MKNSLTRANLDKEQKISMVKNFNRINKDKRNVLDQQA